MFVLAELKSTVKVHPSLFSKSLAEVTKFELNKKLANKVLHKGLKFSPNIRKQILLKVFSFSGIDDQLQRSRQLPGLIDFASRR